MLASLRPPLVDPPVASAPPPEPKPSMPSAAQEATHPVRAAPPKRPSRVGTSSFFIGTSRPSASSLAFGVLQSTLRASPQHREFQRMRAESAAFSAIAL